MKTDLFQSCGHCWVFGLRIQKKANSIRVATRRHVSWTATPLRKPVHCLCPKPGVGRAVVCSEACQVKIVFGQVRKITYRFFGQELDSWLPPKLIFCMCAPFYLLVLCKFQNAFMCIIILKSHKMKLSPLFIVGSLWDGLNGLFLPTMLRDSWKRSKIILFKEQAQ